MTQREQAEVAKAAILKLQRMQIAAIECMPVEEFEGVGERVESALGLRLEEMVELIQLRGIEMDADTLVAGMLGGAAAVAASARVSRPLEDA